MFDDETAIRSMLASPGDDASRLVYADWLEEHDDPRADYLRAELAWAQNKTEAAARRLGRLTKKLDAVWVARVSRPPVGVCCDHVRFSGQGLPISAEDMPEIRRELYEILETTETLPQMGLAYVLGNEPSAKELRALMPAEFEAFVLNYNGGSLEACHVADPSRAGAFLSLKGPFWSFVPAAIADSQQAKKMDKLIGGNLLLKAFDHYTYAGRIALRGTSNNGLICYELCGDQRGAVSYHPPDPSVDELFTIAPTFPGFLAALVPGKPPARKQPRPKATKPAPKPTSRQPGKRKKADPPHEPRN